MAGRVRQVGLDHGWRLLDKGEQWTPTRASCTVVVGYAPWSNLDVLAVLRLADLGGAVDVVVATGV